MTSNDQNTRKYCMSTSNMLIIIAIVNSICGPIASLADVNWFISSLESGYDMPTSEFTFAFILFFKNLL